jgi:hypothetical protein
MAQTLLELVSSISPGDWKLIGLFVLLAGMFFLYYPLWRRIGLALAFLGIMLIMQIPKFVLAL